MYNEPLPETVSTLGHVRLLYHFEANGTEIVLTEKPCKTFGHQHFKIHRLEWES